MVDGVRQLPEPHSVDAYSIWLKSGPALLLILRTEGLRAFAQHKVRHGFDLIDIECSQEGRQECPLHPDNHRAGAGASGCATTAA
jgi:hypothetical protein